MTTSPIISVIIPAYNAGKYIERCLNSLLLQSFKDFEVIIVNDGSEDRTIEVIQKFIKKNNSISIQVFSQTNKGVSSARNLGLSQAIGKWITFLDADDELPDNALAEYSNYFSEHVDMIIGGYEVLNANGSITYSVSDREVLRLDRDSAIRLMYEPIIYRYLGYPSGKCYRRSNIENWNLRFNTNIFYNEDRLFTTQYLCQCHQVVFFTKPVYNYYEHVDSAMGSTRIQFTPRFITDLKGAVEMKKSIKRAKGSKDNLILADRQILFSFRTIKIHLNTFRANTIENFFQLHSLLFEGLGFCKYLQFLIRVGLTKLGLR